METDARRYKSTKLRASLRFVVNDPLSNPKLWTIHPLVHEMRHNPERNSFASGRLRDPPAQRAVVRTVERA